MPRNPADRPATERRDKYHNHPRPFCGEGCPAYGNAWAKYRPIKAEAAQGAAPLPPCPICGKPDLFIGTDGKPGCPHCEVAVRLPSEGAAPHDPDCYGKTGLSTCRCSEGAAPRGEGPRDLTMAEMLDTLRWIIEKDGAIPTKGSDREQRFIDLWTRRLIIVGAAPRAEGLDVERLIWRLIESYPGGVEIDNVQRFREHVRARLSRPSDERECPKCGEPITDRCWRHD